MKKTYKNQSGFTLVEILIAAMIFMLSSIMFMGVFSMVSNATLRVENERFAQQDARYAIEQVSREIRGGWDFETADGGKTLEYKSLSVDGDLMDCSMYFELMDEGTDNAKGVINKQCDLLSGVQQLSSGVINVEDFEFAVIQPANEYASVELRMKVKRQDFNKLAKSVELSTRVTSRMRSYE
ncbi:MAG: prepilin-type N-terminal cleavage/methylation domain-containing protein [Patescibacteria group bacterium]